MNANEHEKENIISKSKFPPKLRKCERIFKTKQTAWFLIIVLSIFLNGCYGVLQTAQITPPKKFSHTFAATTIVDDFFISDDIFPTGVGYKLRYGVSKRFELDTGIDIWYPRIRFGGQFSIAKDFAINANFNALVHNFEFEENSFSYYEDIALIIGRSTYGGLKANFVYNDFNNIEYYAFLGKKINYGGKVSIIPEIGVSSNSFLLFNLGFNF